MTTNAQAALQAAATVHAGSKGYSAPQTVTNMAYQFKNWLDMHDRRDAEKAAEERDTVFQQAFGPFSRGGVDPEPPKPGPRPGPKHFLKEDHNGDPICHCGWDPARETSPVVRTREQARADIRWHVVGLKP